MREMVVGNIYTQLQVIVWFMEVGGEIIKTVSGWQSNVYKEATNSGENSTYCYGSLAD